MATKFIPVAIGTIKVKFEKDKALNISNAEIKIKANAEIVCIEKRKLTQSLKPANVWFLSLVFMIADPDTFNTAYKVANSKLNAILFI